MTAARPEPASTAATGAGLAVGPCGPRGADERILPASPRRPRTWRSLLVLMATGGLVALVLGSAPLAGWLEALPAPAALQHAAQSWQEAAARIGLTGFYSGLGRLIRAWEAARFPASPGAPR